MARDFVNLGFLAPGTDIAPLVPALESIWADSVGRSLQDFNFRSVTSKFNELVYEHPIRIPERYALVIRSLLTQEGICLRLRPSFHFLEVAYPYVARRLLTDDDPALRERLLQVLLADGKFQWERLENLLAVVESDGPAVDLLPVARDGLRLLLGKEGSNLRRRLLLSLVTDNRLDTDDMQRLLGLLRSKFSMRRLAGDVLARINPLAA
jgi:predicted unusual protein kinase regulating ubiquinone biosynthesis (AarF/ABC1/UbiB family)